MSGVSKTKLQEQIIKQLTYQLPVLRARLGISQAEIAEKIGISRQTYNGIETQNREMNWTTCAVLIVLFQNNDETKELLKQLNDLDEAFKQVMNLEDELR